MSCYKFSVAMCVYKNDNPEHFKLALDSVLNQTVKPDEIVLVVDGPIPSSLQNVINEFEKPNFFKPIYLPENRGLGNALKVAVENCSYELIARMDSDDIAVENRFEQQIEMFKNDNELDIVGGDVAEFIGDTENVVSIRAVPKEHNEICKYIRKRCPFNHPAVMYKKSSVQAVGGYLDWFWNEDYYLWIRMLIGNCKLANTGTVLVNMRVGEEMYARRGGIRYFKSELGLQKLMLKEKIIGFPRFLINVSERLIIQVLLPNKLRAFVFKKIARK
ncbi:MAG: glycosyltransferase [Clostridia bacterium]|nr:glycosyltransferase [Clostridia bacterium]